MLLTPCCECNGNLIIFSKSHRAFSWHSEKLSPTPHDNDNCRLIIAYTSGSTNVIRYSRWSFIIDRRISSLLRLESTINDVGIHSAMGSSHSAEVPQSTSCVTPSLTLATPEKLTASAQRRIRRSRLSYPLCSQKFTTQRNLESTSCFVLEVLAMTPSATPISGSKSITAIIAKRIFRQTFP